MRRRYVTVDVFTEQRFGGNPLAVVLDAEGLSAIQMQAIAFEFNYAETTFVLPPRDANNTAQVRIFTPRSEVPFAGHPNVGTAFVVARAYKPGVVPPRLQFEEAAGLVPIEVLFADGDVVGAKLTAPEPLSRRSQVPVTIVAKCLGLAVADIRTAVRQPQIISVGLPFLVAEIASHAALTRAKPDIGAHEQLFPLDGADAIYLYTRDVAGIEPRCDIAARMFAPADGILEDPATGSATAAVAAMLAEESPDRDADFELRFLQGAQMGRPSLLTTQVIKVNGALTAVQVGGHCVQMMEGTFDL